MFFQVLTIMCHQSCDCWWLSQSTQMAWQSPSKSPSWDDGSVTELAPAKAQKKCLFFCINNYIIQYELFIYIICIYIYINI